MKVNPVMRALLWPASMLYGGAVRLRARLYRAGVLQQKRLNGVVISVGNLTVGGTGKTPFVLWLAEHLHRRGEKVGILSRGYRGGVRTNTTPTMADVSALRTSDEVEIFKRVLGQKASIGVGADRYSHGLLLEKVGIEWFILDDGFQHQQLARDVDIVLIDATDPFGGGKLLPAGGLREPRSALWRADIIVITRSEHAPAVETLVRRYTVAPIFYATTFLEEVRVGGHSRVEAGVAEWLGKKAFAFCGIGNSAAFLDDLRRWSFQVAGHAAFPDHHRYTEKDRKRIEAEALAVGAEILVATEKDSFNLGSLAFEKLPVYHCHVTMRVTEAEEFWQALDGILERRLGGQPA